ncbi:hypothetical protein SLA2020_081410 [Shorea laevis]
MFADRVVANLSSGFSSFFSSNNGDKLKPSNNEIMWNAFMVCGCFDVFSPNWSSFASTLDSSSVWRVLGTDFLNHDDSLIFEMEIRELGLGSRSLVISRCASGENHGGHLKSPL